MEQSAKLTCVNLRGTSGSGKTTIVRNILMQQGWHTINAQGKIWGYANPELRWIIIGSYENTCGGCDTIRTQQEVEDRIEYCLNQGYNVLFEGLLISTLTSRWLELAKRVSDRANVLFYYLDTPIEECLRRIDLRRKSAGNFKELNPKNTVDRVKAIDSTYKKLSQAGCYCLRGSQQEIIKNLNAWFGLGGNNVPQ